MAYKNELFNNKYVLVSQLSPTSYNATNFCNAFFCKIVDEYKLLK